MDWDWDHIFSITYDITIEDKILSLLNHRFSSNSQYIPPSIIIIIIIIINHSE